MFAILCGAIGGMGLKSRYAKIRLEAMGKPEQWVSPPQYVMKYKWEYGGKMILTLAALLFAPPEMIAQGLKYLTWWGIEMHLLAGVVAGFTLDYLFAVLMRWYSKLYQDIRTDNGNENGPH